MSTSPFGHGEPGQHRHARFLWVWVFAVFLALWFVNAWIFHLEMVHEAHTKVPEGHSPAFSIPEALYRSLQLFHFHDTHWGHHPTASGYFARLSASAFALGLPLLILGWFCQGGLRRWGHRAFGRNFVVVVGDGEEARHLAGDLVRQKRSVLLVTTEEKGEHQVLGAMQIIGNPATPSFWRGEVRVNHASAVVLMAEEDATNIRWSLSLERAVKVRKDKGPLPCHRVSAAIPLAPDCFWSDCSMRS